MTNQPSVRATVRPSPLLAAAGAVSAPEDTPDAGVAWHYGDPFGEQRAAATAAVVIDRSHRGLIAVSGADRLSWLHAISSQHLTSLTDGHSAENLVLDINGRIEQHFVLTDLDGTMWIDTEAPNLESLLSYLTKMVFWAKVEVRAAPEMALLSILGPELQVPEIAALFDLPGEVYGATPLDGGGFARRMPWPTADSVDLVVPRDQLTQWWERLTKAGARPAGMWTFEALRVAVHRPRLGVDTDDRTIPHEVRWIGGVTERGAVHLDKGCYRGQETVARVHNLGKPPRHLVLLHLDGSAEGRPEVGAQVTAGARAVGRLGTVIDHYELGPIALALVKRTIPADTPLEAGPCAAAIDPDSIPSYDDVQPGRAAVDRLRGK